jgi:hypothetical protein
MRIVVALSCRSLLMRPGVRLRSVMSRPLRFGERAATRQLRLFASRTDPFLVLEVSKTKVSWCNTVLIIVLPSFSYLDIPGIRRVHFWHGDGRAAKKPQPQTARVRKEATTLIYTQALSCSLCRRILYIREHRITSFHHHWLRSASPLDMSRFLLSLSPAHLG